MTHKKDIRLIEYKTKVFPRNEIPNEMGELLWKNYNNYITVEFPSPKTEGQWQLTSKGYVGYIPLTQDIGINLQPKVSLDNLFRMLEYAYKLKFKFLEGVTNCESIKEFYERLANILALKIIDRARKGFYRAYISEDADLSYLRGRLNLAQIARTPWEIKLPCHYEEHTADIEENQILAWTLSRIIGSGICSGRVLHNIREAYRSLRGAVSLKPFTPKDCIELIYNRLNDDYRPIHALCRFFLEHSGPSHKIGEHTMIPFVINMERLYELFVAEWLKKNLPRDLSLSIQEKVDIGERGKISFRIDLVINDVHTGDTICVLDTKYKISEKPDTDDVAKVVAYAEMKGCKVAVLIYPKHLDMPIDDNIGNIRVKSTTFLVDGDLEQQGRIFLKNLYKSNIIPK